MVKFKIISLIYSDEEYYNTPKKRNVWKIGMVFLIPDGTLFIKQVYQVKPFYENATAILKKHIMTWREYRFYLFRHFFSSCILIRLISSVKSFSSSMFFFVCLLVCVSMTRFFFMSKRRAVFNFYSRFEFKRFAYKIGDFSRILSNTYIQENE